MLSNWQDYSLLRNRIVSFTVPVTWSVPASEDMHTLKLGWLSCYFSEAVQALLQLPGPCCAGRKPFFGLVRRFYCLEPHLSMTVLDQRPVGLAVLLLIRFRVVVMMW